MEVIRYVSFADTAPRVAVRRNEGTYAIDGIDRVADLMKLRKDDLRRLLVSASNRVPSGEETVLLPPVDGDMEVWASGVTYEISRDARIEESTSAAVYKSVYDAARPELFFKSPAWRVVTDGEPIGIRDDSELSVPEPELGLIVNRWAETVGFVVCNDVSSRSIEGANPLYLPQAKVYAGACAVAAAIKLEWEVPNPSVLDIQVAVWRDDNRVWHASTSTARLHRSLSDLSSFLFRGQDFPDGALLLTGTGLVPDANFSLRPGDRVDISIEQVGSLSNYVVEGKHPFGWLDSSRDEPTNRVRA